MSVLLQKVGFFGTMGALGPFRRVVIEADGGARSGRHQCFGTVPAARAGPTGSGVEDQCMRWWYIMSQNSEQMC